MHDFPVQCIKKLNTSGHLVYISGGNVCTRIMEKGGQERFEKLYVSELNKIGPVDMMKKRKILTQEF